MKEEELGRLASRLTSKHLPVKKEWLRACVEYLDQSFGQRIALCDKTVDLIFDQILHSKLSESINPIMKIPINAVTVFIVKRMVFEVTSHLNISVSLYEQLSDCTRHNDDLSWFHGGFHLNHEEENREKEKDTTFQADKNNNNLRVIKKRGMLKLEINDGVNALHAIELEEVFDEKMLLPGSKILLTGRVKCRRGVLLLMKSNCMLLGGRIESIQQDKIKQLSTALKIDLDAEKKRRQESLEKAAASVTRRKEQKKNTSLNQSSLSPFLVKMNRKTGEVVQNHTPKESPKVALKAVPEVVQEENFDFSIEEIPVEKSVPPKTIPASKRDIEDSWSPIPEQKSFALPPPPPPLPTKRLSSLVINPSKIPEEPAKTFRIRNPINPGILEQKQNVRKLPGQLLSSSSPVDVKPLLGNPNMRDSKRKNISNWVWDDRKGSEEEEVTSTKRRKDDSVMEIPDCFLIKTERNIDDPQLAAHKQKTLMMNRNIHGPRRRVERNQTTSSKSPEKRITDHYQTVKGVHSLPKLTKSPEKLAIPPTLPVIPVLKIPEVQPMEYEEPVEEINEEEYDGIDLVTPVRPPRIPQAEFFEPRNNNVNEKEDSILECTIEHEGIRECERWGLRGRYRGDPAAGDFKIEQDSIPVYQPMKRADIYNPQVSRYSTQFSSSQQGTSSTRNWNFEQGMITPPKKSIKREEEDRRIVPRVPIKRTPEIQVMRNKQSANVQIYRTPFAKRLNSSDGSQDTTSQLFKRMTDLQIVPLADALVNRKFWMMSKIIVVMPTICHQLRELQSDGIDWLLQLNVTDTSKADVRCRVATDLLNRIFGFDVQQCKMLFNSNQVEELKSKKLEAERKLAGFKRLDLLMWIEVSPDHEKLPLIIDVKTISDALNVL